MGQQVRRREVIRAVPLVVFGSAMASLARFLVGCSDAGTLPRGPGLATQDVPPTDGDEFVPATGEPPLVATESPPIVPNAQWESRARQLEDEQARLYGPVFTKEAPGQMVGKERSHVPQVALSIAGDLKRVTVLVQHVMGKNGLDAGAVGTADASDAADAHDAADARDASDAAREAEAGGGADAGEAGKPPVHYITTVYLRADIGGKDTVVGLWEYASTDAAPPTVQFTLPAGVASVVAYEWCTLHGLWKAAPLAA